MAIDNYIEDDWDDNALTERAGSEKDVYYNYGTGGAGDLLKGVYRPRWNTESGSPTANDGEFELSPGNNTLQKAATPSNLTTGEWSYNVQYQGGTVSQRTSLTLFANSFTDAAHTYQDSYSVVYDDTDGVRLQVNDGGSITTLITYTTDANTNTRSVRVTRDSYGSWEMFVDGTSRGTATDTKITESKIMAIGNDSDQTVNYDNLVVQ